MKKIYIYIYKTQLQNERNLNRASLSPLGQQTHKTDIQVTFLLSLHFNHTKLLFLY